MIKNEKIYGKFKLTVLVKKALARFYFDDVRCGATDRNVMSCKKGWSL